MYRVEGPESAKANSLVTYTLFSENEQGELIDVEVHHLDGWLKGPAEARGKVIRVGEGQYNVEFYPPTPGVYHLEVSTEGKQIFKKGDITTTITDHDTRVRDRINFELEGFGLHSGRTREHVEFTVRVFDSNKRPIDIDMDALEVEVRGPTSQSGRVSKTATGAYTIGFTVDAAGNYTVSVHYDGRLVLEQDGVKFSDRTSAHHSVISQVPSSEIRIGSTVHFRIQSKDSRGNAIFVGGDEWEALASGPERVSHLTITDNLDGTYTGEFILPKAGNYSLEVRLQGEALSNSPIKVKGV